MMELSVATDAMVGRRRCRLNLVGARVVERRMVSALATNM